MAQTVRDRTVKRPVEVSAPRPARTTRAVRIERLRVTACAVPTEEPESDGTLRWDHTTIVIVHAGAGGLEGIGYTYGTRGLGALVRDTLACVVEGLDAMSPPAAHRAMRRAIRNDGEGGLMAMALSAVDCALWDLKARLLGVALATLLGRVRDRVPVYGSGGFTSLDEARLCEQLAGWVEAGIPRVKMKVGRDPGRDPARVRAARRAIGPDAALFVDANGAYDAAQALAMATRFAEDGVTWFEEPRPSGDVAGLRFLRDRMPPGMEVAAGEYADTPWAFAALAGAVHVLQADASRCGGITGLRGAAGLCEALHLPMSAHCCPGLHAHPCATIGPLRHVEWFHDHVRVERLLFDGLPELVDGALVPDPARPGNGLILKASEADRFRV